MVATIWQLLEDCVQHLDEPFRRSEIIGWFRRHHPAVNETSLAAHIQAAVDAPGRGGPFATRTPILDRVSQGIYVRHRRRPTPPSTAADAPRARQGEAASTAVDIALVSCGKRKLDHPAQAADLYTGAAFRKAREYAEARATKWFVVSARYGLLAHDEVVGPYDLRLDDRSRPYREAWATWVVAQLAEAVGDLSGSRLSSSRASPTAHRCGFRWPLPAAQCVSRWLGSLRAKGSHGLHTKPVSRVRRRIKSRLV